jgi:hypothetical protein
LEKLPHGGSVGAGILQDDLLLSVEAIVRFSVGAELVESKPKNCPESIAYHLNKEGDERDQDRGIPRRQCDGRTQHCTSVPVDPTALVNIGRE